VGKQKQLIKIGNKIITEATKFGFTKLLYWNIQHKHFRHSASLVNAEKFVGCYG